MRRALLIGLPLFWLVIGATCFLGVDGMRAPGAILGMIAGAHIIPMIVSFIALATAMRALKADKRPVGSIVVIVLCAAWAIWSVPRFWNYLCRVEQSEARANLSSLLESGRLKDSPKRYEYSGDSPDSYRAVGIGTMAGDEWVVRDGKPFPSVDRCAR